MNSLSGKRAIFIGGTSYSGSTLLDMLLSNDINGFSCGEVHALVNPLRRYHFSPRCGCGKISCTAWSELGPGTDNIHEKIFCRNKSICFLVDSSKTVDWLERNGRRLAERGCDVQYVLIWKTPEGFRQSRSKRGEQKGWARGWIYYHRLFLDRLTPCTTVRYSDLVNDPETLPQLCSALGLSYFKGKERYWEREQHTLFGNSSAKIHLHSETSIDFARMQAELSAVGGGAEGNHRRIVPTEEKFLEEGSCTVADQRIMEAIRIELDKRRCQLGPSIDVRSKSVPWSMAGMYIAYQRYKRRVERLLAPWRS